MENETQPKPINKPELFMKNSTQPKLMNKHKLFMVSSSFLTAIFNTIALLYIARNLGTELLGAFSFIISFVGIFSFLGDMGYSHAFIRAVDKGFKFSECYTAYRLAKLRQSLLLVVITSGLIAAYHYFLAPEGYTPVHIASMVTILGYVVCINLAQIWIMGMFVRGKQKSQRMFDAIDSFVKVFLIITLIELGFTRGGQETIFGLCISYLAAGIFGLMIVRNSARRRKARMASDEVILEIGDIARKIMPFTAFGMLILHIDKILLWYWWGLDDIGLYFGAQRIVIFIAASSGAIAVILEKAIIKFEKDNESMGTSLRMTERYITLMALPVTAFYILFSHDLLTQFLGEDFGVAADSMILLAVSGLFVALASPSVLYLVQTRKYKLLSITSAIALVTNLTLCLLLIPPDLIAPGLTGIHGINGAAIALLISTCLAFIGYRVMTAKEVNFRPHPRIILHLLATVCMIVIIKFLIWYFAVDVTWYTILLFAPLGAFFYGVMLYLSGEFLRKDFITFKGLMD